MSNLYTTKKFISSAEQNKWIRKSEITEVHLLIEGGQSLRSPHNVCGNYCIECTLKGGEALTVAYCTTKAEADETLQMVLTELDKGE